MPPIHQRWDTSGIGQGFRTTTTSWDYRWCIIAAIAAAVAVHAGIFLAMRRYRLPVAPTALLEKRTGVFETEIERLSIPQDVLKNLPSDTASSKKTDITSQPIKQLPDITAIAEAMQDRDFTATPTIKDPVRNLKLSMPSPGTAGDLLDKIDDVRSDIDASIAASMLSKPSTLSPSLMQPDEGQAIIDPLKDTGLAADLKADVMNSLKKGTGGNGGLEGFANLDDLINVQGPITADFKTMLRTDLLFDFGSSALRDGSRLSLMKLGMLIQTNGQAIFRLIGHTDTIGDAFANQRLSELRAEAVRDWLVSSLRIDARRIITEGRGENEPVPDIIGTAEEQQLNRRVEIHKSSTSR